MIRLLLYIVVSIQAANTYLVSVPEIPRWVNIIMGLASVLAVIAREQLKPDDIKQLEKKEVHLTESAKSSDQP